MKAIDQINQRLLVILGLSPETAKVVMERIEELENDNARLNRLAGSYTVDATEYDKLAEAALWLSRACKDRLPPGHYDKVSEECRTVDSILGAFNPRQ